MAIHVELPELRNRYGLDARYYQKKLLQLLREFDSYKPDELARALGRLARLADERVLSETEFLPKDLPVAAWLIAGPQQENQVVLSEEAARAVIRGRADGSRFIPLTTLASLVGQVGEVGEAARAYRLGADVASLESAFIAGAEWQQSKED